MRIAVSAMSAQAGAGLSVLSTILPRLAARDRKNTYVVFYGKEQHRVVDSLPTLIERICLSRIPRNPFLRVLWEQIVYPFYLHSARIDLLYSVGNTTSIAAFCPIVLLVENVNPYSRLALAWTYRERIRLRLLRIVGWLSARRARRIRFVSKTSRDVIVPQLGVSLKKCVVIPHGITFSQDCDNGSLKVSLHGRYILAVGVNGPHRNTERLLIAFAELITRFEYQGNLVILGGATPHYRERIISCIDVHTLKDRVHMIGEVDHMEINSYYRGADVLVFPSLEETFGIPVVEAMALGVPVVTSDGDLASESFGVCCTPFREICGDAAIYFDPFDAEHMARTIQSVLVDPECRRKMIECGLRQSRNYALDATVRELVRCFHYVVSNR